jgi:hypothetical protein
MFMNEGNKLNLGSVSKRYLDKNGKTIREGDTFRTWNKFDYLVEKIGNDLFIDGTSLSKIATTWFEVVNVC